MIVALGDVLPEIFIFLFSLTSSSFGLSSVKKFSLFGVGVGVGAIFAESVSSLDGGITFVI